MRHLQSKKVTNESMFGYALAHAKDDFMFFGGNKSRFEVLCIQFTELPKEAALEKKLKQTPSRGYDLPFSTGIVGLVSYDDYSSQKNLQKQVAFLRCMNPLFSTKRTPFATTSLNLASKARFDEGTYEKSYEEILAKI